MQKETAPKNKLRTVKKLMRKNDPQRTNVDANTRSKDFGQHHNQSTDTH